MTEWKKTLLGQASNVFDRGKSQAAKETKDKRLQEKLYKNIGQLKVEVDFLKDSREKLGVLLPEEFHG